MSEWFSLFFSPVGRLSPWEFWRASFVLITINFVLEFSQFLGETTDTIAIGIFFLSLYPWICLLVKRLRTGNRSPWWALPIILLYALMQILIYIGLLFFITPDFTSKWIDYVNAKISETDFDIYLDQAMDSVLWPSAISSVIFSLMVVWLIDKLVPERADNSLRDVFS